MISPALVGAAASSSRAASGIVRTSRVLWSAVWVLSVSMTLTLGHSLWEWWDVLINDDVAELDEWLALVDIV